MDRPVADDESMLEKVRGKITLQENLRASYHCFTICDNGLSDILTKSRFLNLHACVFSVASYGN